MKFLIPFFALALVLAISCATAQNGPEDKIIGRWKGYPIPAVLVISKDHTLKAGEDPCEWSYENGKYLIWGKGGKKEDGWTGSFDAKGRLVLKDTQKSDSFVEERDPWIFTRIDGDKPADASATGVAPTVKDLTGEWRFAHTIHSHFNLAPTFDITTFTEQGKIQTTSTLISQKLEGNYKLAGNKLKLTELDPKQVTNDLTARLEDNGKTLVLAPNVPDEIYATEWVHLRPDRFLPNSELAGTWINKEPETTPYYREMELRKDSRLIIVAVDGNGKIIKMVNGNEGKHYDYYRLWSSPTGKMMTTVFVVPELGVQAMSMKYERKNDT